MKCGDMWHPTFHFIELVCCQTVAEQLSSSFPTYGTLPVRTQLVRPSLYKNDSELELEQFQNFICQK